MSSPVEPGTLSLSPHGVCSISSPTDLVTIKLVVCYQTVVYLCTMCVVCVFLFVIFVTVLTDFNSTIMFLNRLLNNHHVAMTTTYPMK